MGDSQKLVLMIQPTRLQGLIWHAVLKSQKLAVIWETPDFKIEENLAQLEAAGLPLPNLLLVDVRLKNFNPYAFCRSCRDRYPSVKVVLTNSGQREIAPSERQWAMNQGAADLMGAFQRQNLVTMVTEQVQRVLEILDDHPFKNKALIAVLFSMKRELEAMENVPAGSGNGEGEPPPPPPFSPLPESSPAVSPNGQPKGLEKGGDRASERAIDPNEDKSSSLDQSDSRARRRYRGRKY